MSFEAALAAIGRQMDAALAELRAAVAAKTEEPAPWVSRKGLAALALDVRTVEVWARAGRVARTQIGRRVLYRRADVLACVEASVDRDVKPDNRVFRDAVDRALERRALRVVGGRR